MKIKVKSSVIKLILAFLVFFSDKNYAQEALVAKPVIDLTGAPLKKEEQSAAEQYKQFALMGSKNPAIHCPRLQQLLLHEPVNIVEEVNDEEVRIKIPHLFWIHKMTHEKLNELYTLKENLISINQLKDADKLIKTANNRTCILTKPYYDPLLNATYSAATIFVVTSEKQNYYIVHAFDPHNQTIQQTILPKDSCVINNQESSIKERKVALIKLAREWATGKDGIVYVWGGSSYQHRYLSPTNRVKQDGYAWYQTEKPFEQYAGYDCSSLIYRLAQICNIPFPYKNTSTMLHYLPKLQKREFLEEGDIFFYPGHIALVADLKNNTLIEARGHDSGYGRVHEIPLSDYFQNISTFNELITAYHEQRPLTLLAKDKQPITTIQNYAFLKLVDKKE